jgi:hypothetical protein
MPDPQPALEVLRHGFVTGPAVAPRPPQGPHCQLQRPDLDDR